MTSILILFAVVLLIGGIAFVRRQSGETMLMANAAVDSNGSAAAVIGALIESDGGELPPNLSRLLAHAPESFYDMRHGQIAEAVRKLRLEGKPVHQLSVLELVKFDGASLLVPQVLASALPVGLAEYEADTIWKNYVSRRTAELLSEAQAALLSAPEQGQSIRAHVVAGLEELDGESESLPSRLAARKFDQTHRPAQQPPRFCVGRTAICTPGNLTAVTAASKSGKSNFVGAMMAAAMTSHPERADCLGLNSSNAGGLAVIHLDPEQSVADHFDLVDRSLRRAMLTVTPPWLLSYCVTGFTVRELRECLTMVLRDARKQFGGVHSVLLDGVADFVADVNDPAESGEFIAALQALAIEFDCPIVGVIHLNPGSDKTRGHLGSQLERKAETNLRLEKDGDATVVWSDKNRRAPIPKDTGPRFRWDDGAAMHVTVESKGSVRKSEEAGRLRLLRDDAFGDRPSMRYGEVVAAIKTASKVSENTAARRFNAMREHGLVEKFGAMLWVTKDLQ